MQGEMQWAFSSTNSAVAQPSNLETYTYAGSPTRYSMTIDEGGFPSGNFTLPTDIFEPSGWIAMAVYSDGAWISGRQTLMVRGGASGRFISIETKSGASNLFRLVVDNTEKATFTVLPNDWQYLALKYDMSTDPWSGRAYLNGVAVTNSFTQAQPAESAGSYSTYGSTTGIRAMYVAQYIIYDDLADAGEVPLFVTRIAPNADTSEAPLGGWVASSGGDNYVDTAADPFVNTTYTEQATPASADNVVTEVANLVVQLGVTSNDVLGVTNHTYSSGTALQAFASVRDSFGFYANGATVTPDASPDTTYAYATQTTGFTGSSVVECKYEIV